jgi:methionine-gamma-lyase
VLAGAVATTAEWATKLRQVRAITGGILHPLGGYLLHRGIQTLPVRVRAQQAGAAAVAAWLTERPEVARVYYPGLPSCDPEGLVGRQMAGPGSVLAFSMAGGFDAAATVAGNCQLITHAVSLGGVDSLIQHPASLTHRPVAAEARPHASVLRLSAGLEDPEDLCADLEKALSALSSH